MADIDMKPDSTEKPARPRRRWYQFTLRTAGVWIALFSLLLGSFAWWRDRAERQRKVVEELRGLGATVRYRHFSLGKKTSFEDPFSGHETYLQSQLRRRCGDDFICDVDFVDLSPYSSEVVTPSGITRSAMHLLRKLPRVRCLHLAGNEVSGSDLEELPFLNSLERLSLEIRPKMAHGRLTNEDFAVLKRTPCLERLDLQGQTIGDSGAQYLRFCPRLRELSLSGTVVGDEGLQSLSELTELDFLDLSRTRITDTGLKYLRNLSKLADLNLRENAITGKGFADIGPKTELRDLDISETQFTDDALRHLARFPKLEYYYLEKTRVTGSGIAHLADAKGGDGPRGIDLNGCPVTDETIAGVKIPDGWQVVVLSGTKITDDGFCKLELPSGLERIFIDDTGVTDASLEHLHGLPNLSYVDVADTQVRPEGIDRFKTRNPNCQVRN